MSWAKCIRVSFNCDSTGHFHTGDIVTGIVTLDLDNDEKIESIDMEVKGISKAQWTRSMPTVPYIKVYSEKKKILFIKIANIFGNFQRGNTIPAGIYSYPFHFALAQDLPSSFKSSIASVYYNIKIKSKPIFKVRKVAPFNVIGKVNINNTTDLLAPHLYEFNRILKSVAGKVTVHLKTYKAIASRQRIPFEVTINNEKKIYISKIVVSLIQKLRYTVTSGYATEEKNISKVNIKNIGNPITELYHLSMEIPQIPPSTIYMTEPMIEITYVFRVEVCFSFHYNLLEDIPIVITSVPVINDDF